MKIKIVAVDKAHPSIRQEINDLYWFEEGMVHWFDEDHLYDYEIFVDDVLVYQTKAKD